MLAEQQLRALYGHPRELVSNAWGPELEATTRSFIEASPFMVLSSVNRDGFVDISPRGGEPGFVRVENSRLIRFLDQMGNRKIHTFTNFIDNNKVGVCFFIPGVKELVRVHGVARLSIDNVDIESLGGTSDRNKVVVTIAIRKVFPHCSNALNLAGMWAPETWGDSEANGVPSLLQMANSLAESRGA